MRHQVMQQSRVMEVISDALSTFGDTLQVSCTVSRSVCGMQCFSCLVAYVFPAYTAKKAGESAALVFVSQHKYPAKISSQVGS